MPSSAQCRSSKTSTAGPAAARRVEEAPPGGEVLLLRGLGGLEPEQRPQALGEPGVVCVSGDDLLELLGGEALIVALEHPGLRLDDLG